MRTYSIGLVLVARVSLQVEDAVTVMERHAAQRVIQLQLACRQPVLVEPVAGTHVLLVHLAAVHNGGELRLCNMWGSHLQSLNN